MLWALWTTVRDYLAAGGYVMPPLVLVTLTLWFAIGFRWSLLRHARTRNVHRLVRMAEGGDLGEPRSVLEEAVQGAVRLREAGGARLGDHIEEAYAGLRSQLGRFRTTIGTVVVIAPVLGLLGTVTGMIETFDSLTEMALYTQSGGIAGGISQALFTTQLGLAIAIPGLIVRNVLERRQQRIEDDMVRARDILCGDAS